MLAHLRLMISWKDLFGKHARSTAQRWEATEYTVEGYEAVQGFGLWGTVADCNQVNYVINVAFKLQVGREVDFKISRTPVRTADHGSGRLRRFGRALVQVQDRKHQLIFDESAHILTDSVVPTGTMNCAGPS